MRHYFSVGFLFYGPLSHPLLLKDTITASDLDAGQLLLLSEGTASVIRLLSFVEIRLMIVPSISNMRVAQLKL